jgi:hypothetical protein
MQQTVISILSSSVVAAGALAAHRLVTPGGAYPFAGGPHFGATRTSGSVGDRVTVDVIGTAVVEAGGVVTAFGPVQVDAVGRVIDHDADTVVGRAMTGAAVAGDFVEVLLFQVA